MSKDREQIVYDLEGLKDSEAKQPKVIFAGDQYDGQAAVAVEEDDISMFADSTKGISISEEFGVLISGQVHFASMPAQMSFGGGYWRLDPRHLSTIPSTTPTPIPLLVKATPSLLVAKDSLSNALDFLTPFTDIGT